MGFWLCKEVSELLLLDSPPLKGGLMAVPAVGHLCPEEVLALFWASCCPQSFSSALHIPFLCSTSVPSW